MSESKLRDFKILFVEDEVKIREHIANSLAYMVKEVKQASNGEEALQVMQSFSPDIIITDLEMPKMGGVEFIQKVRQNDKNILIVVVTAHTNSEYLLELIDMHIEHFIVKPINFEKLFEVLQKCEDAILKMKTIVLELPYGYVYDWEKKILSFNDENIKLTKKEISFLELLFKNSRRIVSYEEIENHVWDGAFMTDSALRSLVRNIRKKFPEELIENLSGIGYKLV